MTELEKAWMEPTPVSPLTGHEELAAGSRVRDFWAWAFSDLRLNKTRGLLAQFLVAKALGDDRPTDEGWGGYDVLTPDGVRVEVKSSGYLQSWRQARPSRIAFGGLTGRTWADTEGYGVEREVRADVFVFAVHACLDPAAYDPTDLGAWEFYVVPAEVVRHWSVRSVGLAAVREHAGAAVDWDSLRGAVEHATRGSEPDLRRGIGEPHR